MYIGFWKNGKRDGFGKYIKGKDIKFGIWKDGSKNKLFENNKEFFDNLKDEAKKYKKLYKLSIEDIIKLFQIEK